MTDPYAFTYFRAALKGLLIGFFLWGLANAWRLALEFVTNGASDFTEELELLGSIAMLSGVPIGLAVRFAIAYRLKLRHPHHLTAVQSRVTGFGCGLLAGSVLLVLAGATNGWTGVEHSSPFALLFVLMATLVSWQPKEQLNPDGGS